MTLSHNAIGPERPENFKDFILTFPKRVNQKLLDDSMWLTCCSCALNVLKWELSLTSHAEHTSHSGSLNLGQYVALGLLFGFQNFIPYAVVRDWWTCCFDAEDYNV